MKSTGPPSPSVPAPPRLVDPLRWAVYGVLSGLGAPLGLWVFLQACAPQGEVALRKAVYLYTTFASALVFGVFGIVAGRVMSKLRNASTHDPLTGLANRRLLMGQLPSLIANGQRRNEPLCVLMLDLDHFKRVNDTYGHSVGDRTLVALARSVEKDVRKGDIIARYGGEEFVVICPNADEEAGIKIAERIRESIATLGEDELGFDGVQTISIGLVVAEPLAQSATELLNQADEALYEAKSSGRDRTCVYHPRHFRPADTSAR